MSGKGLFKRFIECQKKSPHIEHIDIQQLPGSPKKTVGRIFAASGEH
jgi:hypothetical protein